MTVDDVLVVRDNILISGKCKNRDKLTAMLVDDAGVKYAVSMPFIKYVISPDSDYITLEVKGAAEPNAIKGRMLKGI